MRNKLINSLNKRIKQEIPLRSALMYLKDYKVEDYIHIVIATLYLYTRPRKGHQKTSLYFSEIICAIGHNVRNKLKQKRDSGAAAKTGAFLLYSFEEQEILRVVLGQGFKHATYVVQVIDDDMICKLWSTLDPSEVTKLPAEEPYAPWTSTKHNTGLSMIKTGNMEVLSKVKPETHPILFECLNRSQSVGWRINREIYDIHLWALRNKTDAFADIWEAQNPEAKATKLREAKAIGEIAKRFLEKEFYHAYYYDFRGRKYCASAYLHEQSSDLSRGLLLRKDSKPIGKDGFFWLLVSIATKWAGDAGRDDGLKTDKIPLKDRADWVRDNEEIILSYAESPKVNQNWMSADEPWQFLAACIELRKLREWQYEHCEDYGNYGYESHLEAFIDGSLNGLQHLTALTRDDVLAPHVNLVPTPLPGDLYNYVGTHVWERIRKSVKEMTIEEINEFEKYIDNLIELKKQINAAEMRSDHRAELIKIIQKFKEDNIDLADVTAPVFWNRITSSSQRRKICKRGVMTISYGSTPYGMGEQIISDVKKHGIELLLSMEHRWGAWLGRTIFEDCKTSLRKPMKLLAMLEAAGKIADDNSRFLSWTVPITNFPVVQNYTEGTVKKVWVQYGPPLGGRLSTGYYENTYQIAICFMELTKPAKGKQSQGASPNAIHSLDAAHLALTTVRCDFPITTIHDSFGCLLADMPKLYRIVRETFVELYDANPINILKEIGVDISKIEFGTLDISDILDSEYSFS